MDSKTVFVSNWVKLFFLRLSDVEKAIISPVTFNVPPIVVLPVTFKVPLIVVSSLSVVKPSTLKAPSRLVLPKTVPVPVNLKLLAVKFELVVRSPLT